MNTAIIYISKHGTTEKVAGKIAKELEVPGKNIFNLRENRNPDIKEFARVIIGGSIHAGVIQKRIRDFCENNMATLLEKETGLFMCGMEKDKLDEEYNNAFPVALRNHSKAKLLAGGEFIFEKMNFLEKAVVKKVSNISRTTSDLNNEAIMEFISAFAD